MRAGETPRFTDHAEVYKAIRERYLLFVNCLESKPGAEPKNAFLYPQAAAAAAGGAGAAAALH